MRVQARYFIFLVVPLLVPFKGAWGSGSLKERVRARAAREIQEIGLTRFNVLFDLMEEGVNRTTDAPIVCQGRLTLTSGTPITTSDVTAATTVYFAPFNGNQISLYSGTRWQTLSFTEKSVAVPSTTSTPFDIFAYNNSGTVALETLDWTNDTTRATNLALQNGVYVKSGAATRRFLGTGRTTAVSGQTEDSQLKRLLINFNNTIERIFMANLSYSDDNSGTSFSSTSTTWTTSTGNDRVSFLVPIAGWMVHSVAHGFSSVGSGDRGIYGIGIDSTSSAKVEKSRATENTGILEWNDDTLAVGYHYIAFLITTAGGASATYYSDDARGGGSSDPRLSYLSGWIPG